MNVSRGHLWRGIGYGLTAAWMIGILLYTGSDPGHPWFDFIFVVPLACWIVAIGVLRLWGPPTRPTDPDNDRRREKAVPPRGRRSDPPV